MKIRKYQYENMKNKEKEYQVILDPQVIMILKGVNTKVVLTKCMSIILDFFI